MKQFSLTMKQFSLEEYLKNPSRKVVTRMGESVRIICTDAKQDYPVVALVTLGGENSEFEKIETYTKDGRCFCWTQSELDLFFAPEKHEGWINVYLDAENNGYVGCYIYKSKEEAEESGKKWDGYKATIKAEWEE